ncbi:MAG: flagellin FliC [Myxococcales bacterium]|nr:flagellin FliC [Myxococcales bacterium]
MGLRVNTNIASLNAQRNLSNSTRTLNTSLERLSSGLRINRAADDAAGLAISEGFRAEIRSLEQAQRNALDAVSLVQIGEGALDETSNILIRMRELAVQSANGTLGTSERASLNQEVSDLISEIDRIAAVTEFNGISILGGASGISFQVGVNGTSSDTIVVSGVTATASALGVQGLSVSSAGAAQSALGVLDSAISSVASLRATFGTTQNRLESTVRSIATAVENLSAAESRIRDVDVAAETANLTRTQVLQQAGVSVLAQANVSTSIALSLL